VISLNTRVVETFIPITIIQFIVVAINWIFFVFLSAFYFKIYFTNIRKITTNSFFNINIFVNIRIVLN